MGRDPCDIAKSRPECLYRSKAALMADPAYAPALLLMEEYRHRGPQAK
ncbi:hypothetical protein [Henriciella marina]|nr:hypothetical protein [Henriciella marina]